MSEKFKPELVNGPESEKVDPVEEVMRKLSEESLEAALEEAGKIQDKQHRSRAYAFIVEKLTEEGKIASAESVLPKIEPGAERESAFYGLALAYALTGDEKKAYEITRKIKDKKGRGFAETKVKAIFGGGLSEPWEPRKEPLKRPEEPEESEVQWSNVNLLDSKEMPSEDFMRWIESQPETKGVEIPWKSFDLSKSDERNRVIELFIEKKG